MEKGDSIQRLMATYLEELDDHVGALNRDLLALEKTSEAESRASLLATLFRTAHSLKGASGSVKIGLIETACHRLEAILSGLRDGSLPYSPALFGLLFSVADALHDAGRRLRLEQDLKGSALEEILPRLDQAALGASISAHPTPPSPKPIAVKADEATIRVASGKLDTLLTRSGELMVARGRTAMRKEDISVLREQVGHWLADWRDVDRTFRRMDRRQGESHPNDFFPRRTLESVKQAGERLRKLSKDLERLAGSVAADHRALEQIADPLEEDVRRLRMVPCQEAITGLDRAVRDLAASTGKEVELVVRGGDIELDRAIVERLKDPLLHLVRNAVDHGIESPAERRLAGKAPTARILISTVLRGAQVELTVQDDGRGLSLPAIRDQARKRNLPVPENDEELSRLILRPGFSTSTMITELSGRGVGLDVVNKCVDSLHGTLSFSSDPGKSMRFVLTVPLTLSTVRVLLVSVAGQVFALIATSVQGLRRIGREELRSVEGREVVLFQEAQLPVMSLGEALGLPRVDVAAAGKKLQAVVVSSGDKRACFVVDEFLAEQEIVIKSLGPRLKRTLHVGGAAILPTGRIALILNAAYLVRKALGRAPERTLAGDFDRPAQKARKRLLVVDDSVTTRSLEKSILESAGYEVLTAADGSEAWQTLQEKGADLVVSDVEMPRMDGFALTETIRGSNRLRKIPVVLVTALENERDKARGLEAGADAYLLKSAFDQKNLLDTIGQLL